MITLENISKNYDEKQILKSISLKAADGQTLAVVGESGCGKTTLLRIIAGLEKSDTGTIEIDGIQMNENVDPHERNIAMVFQDATLWNHMTVKRNITFGMKKVEESKVLDIAKAFGIDTLLNRYPEEISGGQAKRVSLVRALVSDKSILLLDEPLSNLDKETREEVLAYMKNNVCGKKTMLYVTHDENEVTYLDCEVIRL
ncbi:TPA: ABC transporter ATP-binding protein [Streptococcus suis]